MTASELSNFASNLPNIGSPIAGTGDLRAPIEGTSNNSDTQASIKFGLPYLMSQPVNSNGIPVPRQDLNGIFNLLSKITHYLMAGGKVPYSANESTAIGGYPNGAEVSYNGHNYKSKVDSNTALPTDTTKWDCIDYLPLTGGTMTIGTASGAIRGSDLYLLGSSNNTGSVQIGGGSIGAWASFNGSSRGTHPGRITLMARNSSSSASATFYPDGVFAWNGKDVVRSVNNTDADADGNVALAVWPDYASATDIPTGWTATGNGWILWNVGSSDDAWRLYIDGVEVGINYVNDASRLVFIVPIAKNSVVTYTNRRVGDKCKFIPAKAS